MDLSLAGRTWAGLAGRLKRRRPDWWARREPHLEFERARRGMVPTMRRVVLSEWQKRRNTLIIYIAIISLIFHVLLVFAIVYFTGRSETGAIDSIPVQLVMLPPDELKALEKEKPKPPPPPPPQEKQQAQKPPPRGPLASDELGDPDATGKTPAATHAPEAGAAQRNAGEAPPPPSKSVESEKASDVARPKPDEANDPSAAPKQSELPDTPDKLALGGVLAPPPPTEAKPKSDQLAAKELPKPQNVKMLRVKPGGATKPNEHPDDPDHDSGHKAKYPGPDATRDEYLAYIRELTMQQIQRLPTSLFAGKHGMAVFEVLLRSNGSIVWFSSLQSSGDREADTALLGTLNAIGTFPPLPPELRNEDGTPARLTFSLPLAMIGTSP